MMARRNITDRAHRYRAQHNVTGPKKCVLCGSRSDLGVMHLDGNESDGERSNLAWGCRSCNQILSNAFKRIGAGRPTNQYNPSKGVPTFEQYRWAVSTGERDYYPGSSRHKSGAHDEAGAVIHATPKHKRVEYAKRIAREAAPGRRERSYERARAHEDRWNPPSSYRGMSVAKLEQMRPHVDVLTVDNDWLVRDRGRRELEKIDHALALARKREAKKGNPAKLDRCVKQVKKRGGAVNAFAVCKASMKNPFRPPTKQQVNDTEYDKWHSADPNYEFIVKAGGVQEGPFDSYGDALDFKTNEVHRGKIIARRRNPGRRNPRNPADAAAAMSERFHGRPVLEVKEVDEKVHFHSHLAELGELERLKVRSINGGVVTLSGFDGALLCSNEDGTQLFIRGGDQAIDLEEFDIEEPYHDKEELGEVTEIRYFTTKEHLGKDGGTATYFHHFGEDDKAEGRKPRLPRLHYSVRDGRLSFAGGGYRVEPEGIVN